MKLQGFFLAGMLLASPAMAFESTEVLFDRDFFEIPVMPEAKWMAVAASQLMFATASGGESKEHVTWTAMRDCSAEFNDCTAHAAIEIGSGEEMAIAFCADGHYTTFLAMAAADDEESAKAEALSIVKAEIAEFAPDEDTDPEFVDDKLGVVSVCKTTILKPIMQVEE